MSNVQELVAPQQSVSGGGGNDTERSRYNVNHYYEIEFGAAGTDVEHYTLESALEEAKKKAQLNRHNMYVTRTVATVKPEVADVPLRIEILKDEGET